MAPVYTGSLHSKVQSFTFFDWFDLIDWCLSIDVKYDLVLKHFIDSYIIVFVLLELIWNKNWNY